MTPSQLATLLRDQETARQTRERLLSIPFPDARGHVFAKTNETQHPFKGNDDSRLLLNASGLVEFDRDLRACLAKQGGIFRTYCGDILSRIVSPCVRCGFGDWDVNAAGIHAFAPCPFPDAKRATEVTVNVPSGKLAVRVSMYSEFINNQDFREEVDGDGRFIHGGSIFVEHEEAKLWEAYGFAEVSLASQAEAFLYRQDNGGFALSKTSPRDGRKPITEMDLFMPKFACCDVELYAPLRKARRHLLREDALRIFKTKPGTYRIRLFYDKLPIVKVAGTGLWARVMIDRTGPPTQAQTILQLRKRGIRYAASHPWVLESYMNKRFESRR